MLNNLLEAGSSLAQTLVVVLVHLARTEALRAHSTVSASRVSMSGSKSGQALILDFFF
jgi:hypothetical protein